MIAQRNRADAAETSRDTASLWVTVLSKEKTDLQNNLANANRDVHAMEAEIRTANATITQYQNEAANYHSDALQGVQNLRIELQQSQNTASHAQQIIQQLQSKLQQSENDKLHAEQIAIGLNTACQASQKALEQHIAQTLSEKNKQAEKLKEVTTSENNLRARVSEVEAQLKEVTTSENNLRARVNELEAEVFVLKQQESKSREAQGPGTELLRASSLRSEQSLQDLQIRVYFSVESSGKITFSRTYKLNASECFRLQGMFKNVLLQAKGELNAAFSEEWEVAPVHTTVECNEPRGSGHPDTCILSLRGFDKKLANAEMVREATIETDITSIDWDKMGAAFPADSVARMQQWMRRKSLAIERYAKPASVLYTSWVRRNVREGSAKRLSIGMVARLRKKL